MSALHRLLVNFDFDHPPPVRAVVAPWRPMMGEEPEIASEDLPEDDAGFDLADPAGLSLDEVPASDPVAEAVAAALAVAEAAHAEQIAALDAARADEIAAARARWAADEGARLSDGLARLRAEIEQAVAEGVATVIEPFLAEAARVAAIAELRRAIGDLIVSGTGAAIAVTGPANLIEPLQGALAEAGIETARLDFVEADTADVTVTADASTIRTQLGPWAQALKRRLGDR